MNTGSEYCSNVNCPTAAAIRETRIKNNRIKSNRLGKDRDQAMRDLGLTRVKGMLGGVYWE
jgi:hypothetical protein